MLSRFSCVQLCVTLWTVVPQAPLSTGFFRQEYWSGLPYLSPEDLPNPGIEPVSLMSPALAGGFFTTRASLVAQRLKRLPAVWETQVQSLGQEDPLEEEMATHCSIPA